MKRRHCMPFGASVDETGVRFSLWAPAAQTVDVRVVTGSGQHDAALKRAADGWFMLTTADARAGDLYSFVIDKKLAVPDPASRYQPNDVHGPSEIVAPDAFEWTDSGWQGRQWEEAVIYELHVGAFTPEGTYAAAMAKLKDLAALGITAVELMPLAESPGAHNWGYDGVSLFAPERRYGRPDDLKRFIGAAHRLGLMVFLDVVYNHFGPEGNYLWTYAPQFFTERHHTPWGAAINFDGEASRVVRDFYIHNALYWLEEYHFDGLRFDAVHAIKDDSEPHILSEMAERVRRIGGRHIHLVLENDDNAVWPLERDSAGRVPRFTAQWNDDFHHALHVLLTGESQGYYADYADDPGGHFARILAEGLAYQGERSGHRGGMRRGEPSARLPSAAFVSFLQNHDQVGNRPHGERIASLVSAEALRAGTAILLLSPAPPLLFMGEEWASVQPFHYYCDFEPDLAQKVREGRRAEFAQFFAASERGSTKPMPDPIAAETFQASILQWSDLAREPHAGWREFVRRLLDIRHRTLGARLRGARGLSASVHGCRRRAIAAEWALGDGSRLRLVTNLDSESVSMEAPAMAGSLLYATHSDPVSALSSVRLPPWFVAWSLAGAVGR